MLPRPRHLAGALLASALTLTTAFAGDQGGRPPFALRGLQPGVVETLAQTVPVRVVFIGYSRQDIDEAAFGYWLPATYAPLVRYPRFYGVNGRETGLSYSFRYGIEFKDAAFTNRFFNALTSMGQAGDPTPPQAAYNAQATNVLDVTGPVLYIDAPSVEEWLLRHDRGARDPRGYTIYFVNWYGRPDFRFHVYTKTDEPDPDTGYDFGTLRGSRKMIAWGGSSGRVWFHDLSAGPESNTTNYIVDFKDLTGDGIEDYRMPPIWEYTQNGYRVREELPYDLGLLSRFVAINLLFTSSPLYDPLVTAPDVRGGKVAHVAMFEDDPAAGTGLDFFRSRFTRDRLREFQPYYPWEVGTSLNDPIDAGAQRSLRIFAGLDGSDDCWSLLGTPFGQLFCYFDDPAQAHYFPTYRQADYVGRVASFNTTGDNLGDQFGLLGFADDNWQDGTQSLVFTFGAPEYRELGFGFTSTVVHEFGHHIGMSHPHDGYDSEFGFDYAPGGSLYFAWAGDESNTVMHYLSLSNGFGQFDRDNMYRWETAGYLNWSNALAAAITSHPASRRVRAQLLAADLLAAYAREQFGRWNYLESAAAMRHAYQFLAGAAEQIGASSPALERARMPLPQVPSRQTCRVRFPVE